MRGLWTTSFKINSQKPLDLRSNSGVILYSLKMRALQYRSKIFHLKEKVGKKTLERCYSKGDIAQEINSDVHVGGCMGGGVQKKIAIHTDDL